MRRSLLSLPLIVALSASGCARLLPGEAPSAEPAEPVPSALDRAVLEGCAAAALPALPPDFGDFTPVEERLTQRPYLPLVGQAKRVASLDEAVGFAPFTPVTEPGGLPLQAALLTGSGTPAAPQHATLLYAREPVGEDELLPEFLSRGGVVVIQQPVGGAGTAADVVAELGARAVIVKVGIHDAALVHADPVGSNETRPYRLYWSDGERDWSVTGVVAAEELIQFARDIYCP